MSMLYQWGYPEIHRIQIIQDAAKKSNDTYPVEYHGKYRNLPVIEVRIEVPVYRMENVRTKNLQKEWLAQHPEQDKDIFTADPTSIVAQECQHQVLKQLADKEKLMSEFKKGSLQQTEPIICSDNGIVVNGNRRLCVWRTLFYSNPEKYKHFETVRVAVLPDHDPEAMYDLEVALQIHTTMKAEYAWHAIAADCKEKADRGIDVEIIAKKQGKTTDEIQTYIACYDYACQYLKSIGHEDEWSRVDKQYFAFQQIVKGSSSVKAPGDKALFREISKAILQRPAEGDRLYSKIPKVVKNLDSIARKIQEELDIEIKDEPDDVSVLLGGDPHTIDVNAIIAEGIIKADNPKLVVDTVNSVLDTEDELEKEKKKQSFVLDQVKKAATCLNYAVSNLSDKMGKDGVDSQVLTIEATLKLLKDWLK